ncbi:Bcr/CflA family efflux MFS transporter [Desulfovibrio psychrotolerans]|uniref:Bcr/CflA family drug resistance efflux transporter n=1 Tax=Desulfovibrio psychrotolerans TaxID=415242 RepID=A0A7J0BUY3_9BACT|nr:Bcr/CflA family efflux MFS transporter [Desulfovibrio psychrotolerans]GFM37507.1 Bcr/CflA family drug resistance efflux transporter [Desulfovibrio psychrotolerans]
MTNFILILMLAGFPALSTDMYLPAIPTLCTIWGIPLAQANLSLVVFFVCFSAFLLVHGPLSDRFGRRPVLLFGVTLYIGGCLLCAAANSISMLIAARMVQAVGAAAASALSLALAKDLYEGNDRKKLLAYIGVIVPLCTMAAPTVGAMMLSFFSWRAIFLSQGVLALAALYGSFLLREPLDERGTGGVREALGRYRDLMRNRAYMKYAVSFSMLGFAFFGFIAASSDIYITGFGMSAQTYGAYFAFNAVALMCGSLLCSRLCVSFDSRPILLTSVSGMLLAAAVMFMLGGETPARFALPMFAYTFFLGMSRPLSNHMILEQVNRNSGTAASLLTFFFFVCGAAAMELVSLDWWASKPLIIAVLGFCGAAVPLALLVSQRRAGKATPPSAA